MLSIVITIYRRTEYTAKTIRSLLENKDNPIELTVCMDGSDQHTYDQIRKLYDERQNEDWTINCLVPMENVWLVALWNTAVEKSNNLNVFVVNDDILLSKWYDTQIMNELKTNHFVCPLYTEGDVDFWWTPKRKRTNINWHARAIKSDDRRQVWPIDTRLKLWYSDDYIFRKVVDLKQKPFWTENCIVHHYRSQTIDNPKNKEHVDETIAQDTEARKIILKENGRFDERFSHLLSK